MVSATSTPFKVQVATVRPYTSRSRGKHLSWRPSTRESASAPQIEQVATFDGAMPTGVTVAPNGRIFVNFPQWGDNAPFTVAELVDGKAVPYLYFIANQLHRQPGFHGGRDLRRKPYELLRIKVGAGPVLLRSQ